MRVIRIIGGVLLIISILFFVGVLIWSLFKADANTRAGVIGAIGIITVAIFTHYQTKKREIAARHFSDKREAYIKFIDLFYDLIMSTKTDKPLSDKEMIKKYLPIKKAIIVWGGPEIVKVWNSFENMPQDNQSPDQAMWIFEGVLRAIRSDLGHNDSSLPSGSLIALLLVAEDKSRFLDK